MFTGIVEEMGRVAEVKPSSGGLRLTIRCEKALEGTQIGDSIAVDGVCLTVVSLGENTFTSEAMPETLKKTTLEGLRPGSAVNLERAVRLGDRLGGHMVTGHVDDIGRIVERRPSGGAILVRVEVKPEVARYILARGSVALDGISLTVAQKVGNGFVVSVIPHTAEVTTLGNRRIGDPINIETDIIGRYVEALMDKEKSKDLSSLLIESGFLT